MKALTIGQPYAHLICITKEKGVENREWSTNYRGPLVIHAGKSVAWLDKDEAGKTIDFDEKTGEAFTFGAAIGIANLADCLHIDRIEAGEYESRWPGLRDHRHTSGTWCWVLNKRQAFVEPIPYKGEQGLYFIQDAILRPQLDLLVSRSVVAG